MEWIHVSEREPDSDMARCVAVAKRKDGSFYIVGYPVFYTTTGLLRTPNRPLEKGFLAHDVIAWMPWPKHFVENRSGWIHSAERYPEEPGQYLVSIYTRGGSKRVVMASYDEKHESFYGCGDDGIAWMKIPKYAA
jgi:hypothetical protein